MNTQWIAEQVLQKIESAERRARKRRKLAVLCTAALALCAGTAYGVAQCFAPALPPHGDAAQSVLAQSGTQLAQSMVCGDVRFTVEGAVWDDTACYLWLTADAPPQALTDFSFVVQPWNGALVSERTKAQNCGMAFLSTARSAGENGASVFQDDTSAEFMLTYLFAPQDKAKSTLNLQVRAKNGERASTSLRLALNAPRAQAVYPVVPTPLTAQDGAGGNAAFADTGAFTVTKVVVQPFGAVLEGTGGVEALEALGENMPPVKVKISASASESAPAQSKVFAASAASASSDNLTTFFADVFLQYEHGTPRLLLRWNASVDPQTLTEIAFGETVLVLRAPTLP